MSAKESVTAAYKRIALERLEKDRRVRAAYELEDGRIRVVMNPPGRMSIIGTAPRVMAILKGV